MYVFPFTVTNVKWFGPNALETSIVCFLRSIKTKSSLFAKSFLFACDEKCVMIAETQEYLVVVISGFWFVHVIFRFNLAFSQ